MPEHPASRLFVGAFILGLTFAGGTFLLARNAYEKRPAPVVLQRPHLLLGKVIEKGPFELRIEGIGERAGHTYAVIYGAQTRFIRLVPWKPGEKEQAQKDYNAYLAKLPPGSNAKVLPPPLSMNVVFSGLHEIPIGTAVGISSNDPIPVAASGSAMAEVVRPLLPDEASDGIVSTGFPFR